MAKRKKAIVSRRRSRSKKTEKRLEIKREMLASRRSKLKRKVNKKHK